MQTRKNRGQSKQQKKDSRITAETGQKRRGESKREGKEEKGMRSGQGEEEAMMTFRAYVGPSPVVPALIGRAVLSQHRSQVMSCVSGLCQQQQGQQQQQQQQQNSKNNSSQTLYN